MSVWGKLFGKENWEPKSIVLTAINSAEDSSKNSAQF